MDEFALNCNTENWDLINTLQIPYIRFETAKSTHMTNSRATLLLAHFIRSEIVCIHQTVKSVRASHHCSRVTHCGSDLGSQQRHCSELIRLPFIPHHHQGPSSTKPSTNYFTTLHYLLKPSSRPFFSSFIITSHMQL